ncbi:SDR family oxidoreductase [Mycolicibacterium goodii]|uniref:SDR family oxidoreductase n=1 Tax=Mycolicibacterium goodii TaxID=134601 RepID=UPI000C269324|nr:SDR family oxidoreductase [Mycolicibacterium goodii]PJK20758.1 short-chain dehydrogenase [Mycolicibacterium goodii]
MKVRDSVALVTGANRGLGLAFARALSARGARRVYAGMRDRRDFDLPGITPIELDVTDSATVDAAAERCADVTLLINNAGIGLVNQGALDPQFLELSRAMFETNFYGLVRTSQAFAPIITANGAGAILNVLSDATWFARPQVSAYATTKSAAWNYTNALRIDLRAQGVQVVGLHVGFVDTDMAREFDTEKSDPRLVADAALDGLEKSESEVFADEQARIVKRSLSGTNPYYLDPPEL